MCAPRPTLRPLQKCVEYTVYLQKTLEFQRSKAAPKSSFCPQSNIPSSASAAFFSYTHTLCVPASPSISNLYFSTPVR